MIGRNHSNDVFVLGEEVLGEVSGADSEQEAIGLIESAVDREVKVSVDDPFRITAQPPQSGLARAENASAAPPDGESSEGAGSKRPRLNVNRVLEVVASALRASSRAIRPSLRQLMAAAAAAVVLVGLMIAVGALGGRSERVLPHAGAPPVDAAPDQPSKRDSRSRLTREGERQGPQAAAPSSPAAAARVPSVPAAPAPSPPSQGGGPGGRETFGFEK